MKWCIVFLFVLFLVDAEAAVLPSGVRFEDMVEQSESIVLAPVKRIEYIQDSDSQLLRFFTVGAVIVLKGGALPTVIEVRQSIYVDWGKRRSAVDTDGVWQLMFLKKKQNGEFQLTSQNPFQSSTTYKFKAVPSISSVSELIPILLTVGTDSEKLATLRVIDHTDNPALLELLGKILPDAKGSVKNSIEYILTLAKRELARKATVFPEEKARPTILGLFEKWKVCWNASDWKGVMALMHSEDPYAVSWAKGGHAEAEIRAELTKLRQNGAVISFVPGPLNTFDKTAEQTFTCTFANGKTLDWSGTIMMDPDNTPKLYFVRLNPTPQPPQKQ